MKLEVGDIIEIDGGYNPMGKDSNYKISYKIWEVFDTYVKAYPNHQMYDTFPSDIPLDKIVLHVEYKNLNLQLKDK